MIKIGLVLGLISLIGAGSPSMPHAKIENIDPPLGIQVGTSIPSPISVEPNNAYSDFR